MVSLLLVLVGWSGSFGLDLLNYILVKREDAESVYSRIMAAAGLGLFLEERCYVGWFLMLTAKCQDCSIVLEIKILILL